MLGTGAERESFDATYQGHALKVVLAWHNDLVGDGYIGESVVFVSRLFFTKGFDFGLWSKVGSARWFKQQLRTNISHEDVCDMTPTPKITAVFIRCQKPLLVLPVAIISF